MVALAVPTPPRWRRRGSPWSLVMPAAKLRLLAATVVIATALEAAAARFSAS